MSSSGRPNIGFQRTKLFRDSNRACSTWVEEGKITTYSRILCFVYRASLYNLFQTKPPSCTLFLVNLFQILYMFRATICPSSGELTVSIRHWHFCTLYGWLSGLQNRQTFLTAYFPFSFIVFFFRALILCSTCTVHYNTLGVIQWQT